MLGYGAYPITSSWFRTGTPLLRPISNFGDLNAAEQAWEDDWLFGGVVAISGDVAESATGSDQFATGAELFASIAESASISESVSTFITGVFFAEIAENVTGSDQASSLAEFYAGISETGSASDAIAVFLAYYRTISEQATASDNLSSYPEFPVSVSESGAGFDLISARLKWEVIDNAQTVVWTPINTV